MTSIRSTNEQINETSRIGRCVRRLSRRRRETANEGRNTRVSSSFRSGTGWVGDGGTGKGRPSRICCG